MKRTREVTEHYLLTEHKIKTLILCGYLVNDFNLKYSRLPLEVNPNPMDLVNILFGNRKIDLSRWIDGKGLITLKHKVVDWEFEEFVTEVNSINYYNYAKMILDKLKILPSDISLINIIINGSQPDIVIECGAGKNYFLTLSFDCEENFFDIEGMLFDYNNFLSKKIEDEKEFFDRLLNRWLILNFNNLKPEYKNKIREILNTNDINDFASITKDNYYKLKTSEFLGVSMPGIIKFNQFKLHKILYMLFYKGGSEYYYEYRETRKEWNNLKRKFLYPKLKKWTEEFFSFNSKFKEMKLEDKYYYATPCYCFKGRQINSNITQKKKATSISIKNDILNFQYRLKFIDKDVNINIEYSLQKLIILLKNIENFNIKLKVS